jgi:putative tryptophan/tyrosine transport system substrate-binding protein
MRRREFITLLGGATVWPLAARAQQAVMPVVGLLSPLASGSGGHLLDAFRRGLGETGNVEGQNVAIEYRFAGGFDRLAELAADLVRRQVSVIAATGSEAAVAAKAATQTLPIAFIVAEDPVKLGLVASLARPGGNLTGINFFTAEVNAKRLALLRELVPTAVRIGVLMNPSNAINTSSTLAEVEPAARALGLQIQIFKATTNPENASNIGNLHAIEAAAASLGAELIPASVHDGADIEREIDAFARRPLGGLIVLSNPTTNFHRDLIITLAARHQLPAVYPYRYFVTSGGLLSYGVDNEELYQLAASYVDRILRGAKPGDLPIQQPTKLELVINLTTAKVLGLQVPDKLLALADKVIE